MNRLMDLYLTPIARVRGNDQPGLLSLKISEPTSKAIRSRKIDRLVLYMVMTGDLTLRQDQQDQLLTYLTEFYFQKSGSATAAMRSTAEELNKILLEINLRYAKKGQQVIGWLTLLVFRNTQVYLTHCGPMQTFFVSKAGMQHLYDSSMVGHGLGQRRSTPISFYHMEAEAGDGIYLAAQPPSDWDKGGGFELHKLGPDEIQHRLDPRSEPDINVVIIQAKEGSGNFYLTGGEGISREIEAAALAAVMDEGDPIQEKPPEIESPPPPIAGQTVEGGEIDYGAPIGDVPPPTGTLSEYESPAEGFETPASEAVSQDQPAQAKGVDSDLKSIWKRVGVLGAGIIAFFGRVFSGIGALITRALPNAESFYLPSGTMAFMAIFIPVLVVGLASGVYFKLGRAAQYDNLLTQAQEMAINAENQEKISTQRKDLISLLEFLDQVESIDKTQETQAIRWKATNTLDAMDLVKRVNYQPAIEGGLPESVDIRRVLVIDNDLYMLDGNSGSVLHARLTSQGYKPNPSFQCAPTIEEDKLSGPIIDIERWPNGLAPEAEIIAMDASGNLLFCDPENYPEPGVLYAPPSSRMENLVGMTISQGDVYILDPASNAVWIYWNGTLEAEPELFFDVEIPQLEDVIDLSVNNNELYLLHEDGHMTLCVYSGIGVAPTRCSQPSFIDFRSGRENQPMELESDYSQVAFNPPPDPSLYLLEPASQSINHFSLRNLAYQKQYLPLQKLEAGEATAFTLDPIKRQFVLAVGDKLYYGVIP